LLVKCDSSAHRMRDKMYEENRCNKNENQIKLFYEFKTNFSLPMNFCFDIFNVNPYNSEFLETETIQGVLKQLVSLRVTFFLRDGIFLLRAKRV
jgi:hypothetical protein